MPRARIETWHCASLARTAVTTVLCCYAIIISGVSAAAQETYEVAASKNSWNIDITSVSCIALLESRAHIFGSDYSKDPQVLEILNMSFPNAVLDRQGEQCRNVLCFTILYEDKSAVTYKNRAASIVMSLSLCERDQTNKIDTHKCSYKNIYSFLPKLEPLQALRIGVKAFVHDQAERWEIVKVSIESQR